jgi:MoaA/NifB/PqqE/SkfB family radical SAM enzyme
MECPGQGDFSSADYLRSFNKLVDAQRIPLQGSFALTRRCNLRCEHCYTRDDCNDVAGQGELTTLESVRLLDECADAGCLFLLLTGGEPLIRPDFGSIYRHAKMKGMFVTVFTNGTLLTPEHVSLFVDLPPHGVEITLYGATETTYERVTGIRGSFQRCMTGIRMLADAGVELRIKTMLLTTNKHELGAMEKMALDFGDKFRFDACIFPRLNGDKYPLTLRVPPEEAASVELADHEKAKDWREFFDRMVEFSESDDMYWCGAGTTAFHLDSDGQLQPCVMVRNVRYDLKQSNFSERWREMISCMMKKKVDRDYLCRACDKKSLCGYCPGFFELESGSESVPSEYLCKLGHERFDILARK